MQNNKMESRGVSLLKDSLKKLACSVTAFVVEKNVSIGGKTLYKNGILIWDKGTLAYCDRFPRNYKGGNPWLEVSFYDFQFNYWETYNDKSEFSRKLYAIWTAGGYKKTQPELEFREYEKLMKHDRRHKRAQGQRDNVRAITDYDCAHCPQMRAGHVEGYHAYMPYGSSKNQYAHA